MSVNLGYSKLCSMVRPPTNIRDPENRVGLKIEKWFHLYHSCLKLECNCGRVVSLGYGMIVVPDWEILEVPIM
jgi:hypothetical protein